jgi:hypothetical protein
MAERRLSGPALALGVAVAGWSAAVVLAMTLVALLGFFGVGLIGVLVWFICVRVDLEREGAVGSPFSTGLYARQIQAGGSLPPAERVGQRREQGALVQSMRFFRMLGMGLTAIGFGGFLLLQV